jgi:hypothetical protein
LFNDSDVLHLSDMNEDTIDAAQDLEVDDIVSINGDDVTLTGTGLKLAMQYELHGSRQTKLSPNRVEDGVRKGRRGDNADAREQRRDSGLTGWK